MKSDVNSMQMKQFWIQLLGLLMVLLVPCSFGKRERCYWFRSEYFGAWWIRVVKWPIVGRYLTVGSFSLVYLQYQY